MKIVQHPSSDRTPIVLVSEAVELMARMEDAVILWTDRETGEMHVGWSQQTAADLAAYAIVLHEIARSQVIQS